MNFSLDDRHRSLRRFVMAAVGSPPWRVRTERVPVRGEDRPVAVVEAISPATAGRAARVSITQGNVERRQSFSLMLYPAAPGTEEEPGTPSQARLAAQTWADMLDQAITVGLVNDDGSSYCPPERIPIFDYAQVPVVGAARQGPEEPYGWLWVDDHPVRALQDPDDPLAWTVTCDLRISWEQGGRVPAPAPTVGDFGGAFAPLPGP